MQNMIVFRFYYYYTVLFARFTCNIRSSIIAWNILNPIEGFRRHKIGAYLIYSLFSDILVRVVRACHA